MFSVQVAVIITFHYRRHDDHLACDCVSDVVVMFMLSSCIHVITHHCRHCICNAYSQRRFRTDSEAY